MLNTDDEPIDIIIESDVENEEDEDDVNEDDVNEDDDKKDDLNDDQDVDENEDIEDEDEDEDDEDDEMFANDEDDDTNTDEKEVVVITNNINNEFSDSDEDDEDDGMDDDYLQKLDGEMSENVISDYHHELKTHNSEEIELMCKIVRDINGVIIDPLHRTLPFITRYERARSIGERAKQIESGAKPFTDIKDNIIDAYLIALKEFEEKKIPFIIRRPLPSGGSEYWRMKDLEIIN
jgi:DNA-directed RNA polymerase subunit K/omega